VEKAKFKRPNILCSHSFVESIPKMIMVIIIMGHEYTWGTIQDEGGGKERILKDEEGESMVHIYI
jgi:hypothetical protein